MDEIKLFDKCKEKIDWCGKSEGPCILIIYGECKNCSYFLENKNN